MDKKRIFLSPPHMGGEEIKIVHDAFASNYIAPLGPMVDSFEKEFSEYVGIRHSTAVSSGTAAMHLSLRHLGIGPGDGGQKTEDGDGRREKQETGDRRPETGDRRQETGEPLDKKYHPDYVCYGEVIVEIKAITSLTGLEEARIITKLKFRKEN